MPDKIYFNEHLHFFESLNSEQNTVVNAERGPLLVIAGAGSGKTRTLICRIAKFLRDGLPPEKVILVTFTNRAALHMKEILLKLCGKEAHLVRCGTFHKLAFSYLRQASNLDINDNFSMLNSDDAKSLLNQVIAEDSSLKANKKQLPPVFFLLKIISFSLNTFTPIEEVLKNYHPQWYFSRAIICEAARAYVKRKRECSIMDFDDILINFYDLLLRNKDFACEFKKNTELLVVDEFQDTNRLQGEIIDLMSPHDQNLTIVGDDAQSIYGFRGARVNNMLEFKERYKGAKIYALSTNYRSTKTIIAAANQTLAKIEQGFAKSLVAVNDIGSPIEIYSCGDVNQQARLICEKIREHQQKEDPLDNIAILYRAHAHAFEIQLELIKQKIPFVMRSGLRFLEQAHILDMMAFLHFLSNTRDEASARRCLLLFEGIGPVAVADLWPKVSQMLLDGQWPMIKSKWQKFPLELFEYLSKLNRQGADVAKLLGEICERFYKNYVNQYFDNPKDRLQDIDRLIAYGLGKNSLKEFLFDMALLDDGLSKKLNAEDSTQKESLVVLSSIHQAKGLEWSTVFIAWLCEGKFPLETGSFDKEKLDEERRLFYVAITRAKEHLYLFYPKEAVLKNGENTRYYPSRFISELRQTASDSLIIERIS